MTDVRLAEAGPLTDGKLDPKATMVVYRDKPRGCYIKKVHAILGTIIIILIIVIAILISLFISQRASTPCDVINNSSTADISIGTGNPETWPSDQGKLTDHSPFSEPWTKIRLPHSLIPISYSIELTIDLTRFLFIGSVNITIQARERTKYIIVNSNELNISGEHVFVYHPARRKVLEIKAMFFVHDNQFFVMELSEYLDRKEKYNVTIGKYNGSLDHGLSGLYNSSYKFGTETRHLASSQLQSTDARKVFPCFDEPDFKSRFSVVVIHEPEYVALSNMPAVKKEHLPNGWVKETFAETPVMSTYLLAFVVSDFIYKETTAKGGLKVRVWSQPAMIDQTEYALQFAAKTYDYFTGYFGIPEIMPKADHVAVPDFSAGAMENWGLVIYRETALLYDADVSPSSNKYMITLIVAHEIAHTWFGNMVTMKWWTDLWLNEGFASTLMFFAMDDAYPDWNVYALQVAEDIFPVMIEDALIASHPVSAIIEHPNEIIQHFDAISYNKGMAILRMLRGFLGWNDFRRGLRNYIRRYQYNNAEMNDLWQIFTEAVHHRYNVGEIMDAWTRKMGYPVVTIRDAGDVYLLEQNRFLLNIAEHEHDSNLTEYQWYIPFTYKTEHNHVVELKWLELTNATIPKMDGWILGNIDYMGYYKVNYETKMWQQLSVQLMTDNKVFSESNRAGLIDDAFILARAELLGYDIALNITTYLYKELQYVPWRAFTDAMQFLRGMLSTTEIYGMMEIYLKKLVTPVFKTFGTEMKGSLPERYLRRVILGMSCKVGVKPAIEFARSLFTKWMHNGTRIQADYSLIVYSVGIMDGGVKEWDFLWDKALHTNVATEREIMMEALAQTQHSWLLWRYISWVFDDSKIKMQDARMLFTYFTKNPTARMIARQFLMNNWGTFLRMFDDWFSLREIISQVGKYVNTDYELQQLERLFREQPPLLASEAANSTLALIRANIRWKEKSYPVIADWLHSHIQ